MTKTDREMRDKWKNFVNQVNALAEPFDFFIEHWNKDVLWLTFNETDDFKMHTYPLELDTPEIPLLLKAIRSKLANFNSDDEAIFLYQRLNKKNHTLLESIQYEANQRMRIYQFVTCFITVEK